MAMLNNQMVCYFEDRVPQQSYCTDHRTFLATLKKIRVYYMCINIPCYSPNVEKHKKTIVPM